MEGWLYMKNQKIIRKIINYIESILKYTNNVDYDGFRNNSMMVEACVFNLSQIGELVKILREQLLKLND